MKLLDNIKEKGLVGCFKAVRFRVIKCYNYCLLKKYMKFPIDRYSIVLESEGDCCDNAYALFDYMRENGYLKKYKITWLVDHPQNYRDDGNVKYVYKNIHEHFSAETIKALRICHWYIYDHCNMMAEYKKRNEQLIIYLSHGWGYKSAKGVNISKIITHPDYLMATGQLSAQGLAEYWEEPLEKVCITGYPRIDYFFKRNDVSRRYVSDKLQFLKYKKVIFWMPTFRQSINGSLSENYIDNQTGLPLFATYSELEDFSKFLQKQQILVVFKLHHLQANLPVFHKRFSNILILDDSELVENKVQLYQVVKYADAIISDYSSISIDAMVLNIPLIYTLDDYGKYDKSRGLFPKNAIDYMPGYHVYTVEELKLSIIEILKGNDKYESERNKISQQYHSFYDGNSSMRVLELLGINKKI